MMNSIAMRDRPARQQATSSGTSPPRLAPDKPPLLLCVFPSFAVGGAQIRFVNLLRHFGPAYRYAIVALDHNTACRHFIPTGVDMRFVTAEHGATDPLRAARQARAILQEIKPDLLVTSNWGAMDWVAGNLGGVVPHVHTEDGFGPEEDIQQLYRRVIARRLLLRRSTVVLPSRTLLQIAQGRWQLAPAQLRYIPNGIDLQRFAPVAPQERAVPVIGTIAGLRPEKNLSRLLRAFRLVLNKRPARLVLVGAGPQRAMLEQLAATLGIAHVTSIAGPTDCPEAAYGGFDVFTLSSDTEQMSLSLMEAMSSGLPVVATDVGDTHTMVSPDNRPFIIPRDDGAFATALLDMLAEPHRARQIGAANRITATQTFSQITMFEAYAALFDKVIKTRRSTPCHDIW